MPGMRVTRYVHPDCMSDAKTPTDHRLLAKRVLDAKADVQRRDEKQVEAAVYLLAQLIRILTPLPFFRGSVVGLVNKLIAPQERYHDLVRLCPSDYTAVDCPYSCTAQPIGIIQQPGRHARRPLARCCRRQCRKARSHVEYRQRLVWTSCHQGLGSSIGRRQCEGFGQAARNA
jgi:hypothetical protein